MDNLQASQRVAMVAGMWLADGHVTVRYRFGTRGKSKSLTPVAGYTSKDYDFIEFIQDVLSANDIGCHVYAQQKHPKRAQIWVLTLTGHKRFKSWYTLLRPHLFGRKALAADILVAAYDPKGNKYGQSQKPQAQQDKEAAAYELVKRLKSMEASETIRTKAQKAGLWDSPPR